MGILVNFVSHCDLLFPSSVRYFQKSPRQDAFYTHISYDIICDSRCSGTISALGARFDAKFRVFINAPRMNELVGQSSEIHIDGFAQESVKLKHRLRALVGDRLTLR